MAQSASRPPRRRSARSSRQTVRSMRPSAQRRWLTAGPRPQRRRQRPALPPRPVHTRQAALFPVPAPRAHCARCSGELSVSCGISFRGWLAPHLAPGALTAAASPRPCVASATVRSRCCDDRQRNRAQRSMAGRRGWTRTACTDLDVRTLIAAHVGVIGIAHEEAQVQTAIRGYVTLVLQHVCREAPHECTSACPHVRRRASTGDGDGGARAATDAEEAVVAPALAHVEVGGEGAADVLGGIGVAHHLHAVVILAGRRIACSSLRALHAGQA